MSIEAAFHAAGVPADRAAAEAPRAAAAMREQAITTQLRASYFLAQVLHESGRLRWFEELATGREYDIAVNPQLARALGNVHPGDGERYKGRGPIQLTGRANYRAAGHALGLDLEGNPSLAADHAIGWRIAGWYWHTRGLNALADHRDFVGVTRRINGGTNGLTDREAALRAIASIDCRPAKPDPYVFLTRGERARVKRYDDLLRAKRRGHDTRGRQAERQHLRSEMARSRKAIWRAAQPQKAGGDGNGWDHANRRQRYDAMRRRTT